MQRLKQKIEERKKAYKSSKKTPEVITLKEPELIKELNDKTNAEENKQNLLHTENIEADLSSVNKINSDKKNKLKSEFKVLGTIDFEKKSQVSLFLLI